MDCKLMVHACTQVLNVNSLFWTNIHYVTIYSMLYLASCVT
jgi:hypothetical protein